VYSFAADDPFALAFWSAAIPLPLWQIAGKPWRDAWK
jgi:hypothetical protein